MMAFVVQAGFWLETCMLNVFANKQFPMICGVDTSGATFVSSCIVDTMLSAVTILHLCYAVIHNLVYD